MANSVSPLVGPSPGAARRADLLSFPRGVASLASVSSSQAVSFSASCPIRFRHSSVFLQALPVADLLSFPRGFASLASSRPQGVSCSALVANLVSPLVGPSPGAARRADLLSFPRGVASLASLVHQRSR